MQIEGINLGKFRQGKQCLDVFSKVQNNFFLGIFRGDKFRQIQIYLEYNKLIQVNLDKTRYIQVN